MQEIWHKHFDTKMIFLDDPVSWNLKCSILISSTKCKNAPLLNPATALCHRRLQTRDAALDFDRFLLAKFGEGNHLHLRPIENYRAALRRQVIINLFRAMKEIDPTPLKWIDIFQLHYCFLALTYSKLRYLCIQCIFWTDFIYFVSLNLCQVTYLSSEGNKELLTLA